MKPKKVDLFTNIISAVRAILLLGLFNGFIDMMQTVTVYIFTGIISSFLDGKGIPTIAQVTREIQQNMTGGDRPQVEDFDERERQ